jgi:hypothetical protein
VIVPPLEQRFIRTSHANRWGLGIHLAHRRLAAAVAAMGWHAIDG